MVSISNETQNLKQYLNVYPRDQSILLLGMPGIGKSEICRQFAEEEASALGLKFVEYDEIKADDINPAETYLFVDFRLMEVEPSDLIGFPQPENGCMTYKPLQWAYTLAQCKAGFLLLDELTNVARPDIIAASYKIVNERKVGFVKLHNGIRIVAAGNTPEHSALANELPAPLINRFAVLEVESPSLDAWIDYMNKLKEPFDNRVFAYLYNFRDNFIKLPKDAAVLEEYPTPRSWTKLARTLVNVNDEQKEYVCISYLGKEVGISLSNYLKLEIDDVDTLLDNPKIFDKYDTEKKWLAVTITASNFGHKQTNKFKNFIKVVLNNSKEMAFLFFKIAISQGHKQKLKNLIDNPDLSAAISGIRNDLEKYGVL